MSRRSQTLGSWLTIIVFGAGAGLVFNWLTRGGDRLLVGMMYGVAICACTIGFERGLIFTRLRRRLQRLPSLLFILATEILLIIGTVIGCFLAGTLVWGLDLVPGSTWEVSVTMPINVLIYTLLVVALFVFVTRMRDLLGADTFRNLMLGRYHRPAQEERVFLFVDISGSTAYAAAHGDLRAQEYLGAVFAAIAEPVRRYRGAIDDYIGDLAMITWPLQRGINNAACVECLIDINRELAKDPSGWQQRFGVVPQVRAALHGGPIVTAEIGVDRHKIAYFGDVVNTTARLESLSSSLKEKAVISNDLLNRLPALPDGVKARALGEHSLRGRDHVMGVAALDIALSPA